MMHEIPPSQTPANDNGYLEEMTKAIFRSGFSWRVIRDKWDNFQQAFSGFDIPAVAAYGPDNLDRLLKDSGIVRNFRKISATVENAGTMAALIQEHGSFYAYLRSLDHLGYRDRVKVLTQQFSHLGRTGAFVFLHSVNEGTQAGKSGSDELPQPLMMKSRPANSKTPSIK